MSSVLQNVVFPKVTSKVEDVCAFKQKSMSFFLLRISNMLVEKSKISSLEPPSHKKSIPAAA